MKKFAGKRLYQASPLKMKKVLLPPLSFTHEGKLSQSVISAYEAPANVKENEDEPLVRDEIENLIRTSLKNYPKLENYIEKLKKVKIPCKCSVFTKNVHNLDHVHGFSSVACASDYCINRILEEPEDNLKGVVKSPEYYSLSTAKSERKEVNKDLVLFEKSLDKINSAVKYIKSHKNSELECTNLYSEFIKPPEEFKVPRHANLSPNFSVPRPMQKRFVN
jgi:hypothetical protein